MPIIGVGGLPGAGKTYFVVRAMYRLRRRRPARAIVSNFPLYLPGEPVHVIDSISEAYELTNVDLVVDEAHLTLGARQWKEHGIDCAAWLSQLRKRDVNLWYLSQEISSVDKLLRDRTFLTYWVESFKKLGFFVWKSYFGAKQDDRKRYGLGLYLFNQRLAQLYDTEYIIKI